MASSNRDNFSTKVKQVLALRANYRCSFPECNIPTSGPSDESSSAVVNIGVAAHIHAAAPGGSRYNAEMSPEERSGASNGIWLCQTHSRLIDEDCIRYTANILHKMRMDHENRVSAEINGAQIAKEVTDFIAIGPDIVFTGELIGTDGKEWKLRIDHFFIGNLFSLIIFSENFEQINPYDHYLLINTIGDGRKLIAAPAWQKTDSGYIVTCKVSQSFPRISAHNLPTDWAIGPKNDLFLVKGNIAEVSGLNALPQKIRTCLSTSKGDLVFYPNFGTKIKEYFYQFRDAPWLLTRLIKLEVIRQACIPYNDPNSKQEYTPLQSVLLVHNIEMLTNDESEKWKLFRFQLNVEGVGPWNCDVPICIPLSDT